MCYKFLANVYVLPTPQKHSIAKSMRKTNPIEKQHNEEIPTWWAMMHILAVCSLPTMCVLERIAFARGLDSARFAHNMKWTTNTSCNFSLWNRHHVLSEEIFQPNCQACIWETLVCSKHSRRTICGNDHCMHSMPSGDSIKRSTRKSAGFVAVPIPMADTNNRCCLASNACTGEKNHTLERLQHGPVHTQTIERFRCAQVVGMNNCQIRPCPQDLLIDFLHVFPKEERIHF